MKKATMFLFFVFLFSLSTMAHGEKHIWNINEVKITDTQPYYFPYEYSRNGVDYYCALHETARNVNQLARTIEVSTSNEPYLNIQRGKRDFSKANALRDAKEEYKQKKKQHLKKKRDLDVTCLNKKVTGLDKKYCGFCYPKEQSDKIIKLFDESIIWEFINESWVITSDSTLVKNGVQIQVTDENGDVIEEDLTWVEIDNTFRFFPNITTGLPLSKMGFRVYNDHNFYFEDGRLIETPEITETFFTKTTHDYRVIDFNSFVEKEANNLTRASVEAVYNRETFDGIAQCASEHALSPIKFLNCLNTIRYFDVVFEGEIYDTDPELYVEFSSSSTFFDWQTNNTEATNLGLRTHAPVLFMDFNKDDEANYVTDNSIYNNFGTNNGATYNSSCGSSGVHDLGGCYEFDGDGDYIDTGDNNIDDNDLTLTAWVNTRDTSTIDNIAYLGDPDNNWNYLILRVLATGELSVIGREGTSNNDNHEHQTTLNTDTWYHVALVRSVTTVTLYLNGIPSSGDTNGEYGATLGTLTRIGATRTGAFNWNGSIDQVQIWDRALSADEVLQLYNGSINNTNYIGKYARDGDFKSLVYYNSTSTYWNITASLADSKKDILGDINTTDLLNYWKLNGDANDNYGNEDGTVTGATLTWGTMGQFYSFDGGDHITISSNTYAPDSEDLCVLTWIKQDAGNANDFIWNFYASNNDAWGLMANGDDIKIFDDIDNAGDQAVVYDLDYSNWYHIALCINESKRNLLYVDGSLVSSSNSVSDFIDSFTNNFYFARRNTGGSQYNGDMDELMIFNRTLSTAEIQEIYNLQKGYYYGIGTQEGIGLNDSNLVSYWSLDEHYEDIIGGNDGTPIGTNNATGISSGAMRFDGVDDWINCTDNLKNLNNVSISIWARFNPTSSLVMLVAESNAGDTAYSFSVGFDRSDNNKLEFLDGGSVKLTSPETITDTDWHHITFTRNGVPNDWTHTLYKDGVYVNHTTTSNNPSQPDTGLCAIGRGGLVDNYYFNGSIDEVLIYNKSLTASEVMDLYKAGLSQHANTNITLKTRTATSYNTSDTGLVSLWGLNGNASDETGNNDGTASITGYGEENGVVGQGGEFDGVDDYIDIGSDSSIDNVFVNGGTVSVWFYTEPSSLTTFGRILDKSNANLDGWTIFLNTNLLSFLHTFDTASEGQWATPVGSVSAGQWYHLTITYDKDSDSNLPTIYLNGLNQTLTEQLDPSGNAETDASQSLNIGARNNGGGEDKYFNGSIDEVRIYNRTLSAAEVQNLYELGNYHINWSGWETIGKVEDGQYHNNSEEGNFMQMKFKYETDNTDVSAYLLNYSVSTFEAAAWVNTAPVVSNVVLNSTNVSSNQTTEDLTLYFDVTDSEGNATYNYTDWRINGTSWNVLNMPFGSDSNSTYANDISTFDNNGTVTGATWNGNCNSGFDNSSCYSFDGVDDKIYKSTSSFETSSQSGAVSLWFKTETNQVFLSSSDEATTTNFISFGTIDSGEVYVYTNDGGSIDIMKSTNTFADSNWHHAVIMSNSTNTLIYVDAEQETVVERNGADNGQWFGDISGRDNLVIGLLNRSDGEYNPFNGSIDQVQIWNRSLSADEIKQLHFQRSRKQQDELIMPDNNLVSFWKLDGDATDSVGSNDGTVSGATSGDNYGVVGQGYSFDGVDDYVEISDDVTTSTLGSISAWIYQNPNPNFPTIFVQTDSDDATDNALGTLRIYNNDKLCMRFRTEGGGGYEECSNTILNDNEWYHVVATYSDSGTYSFYINGVFDDGTVIDSDESIMWFGDISAKTDKSLTGAWIVETNYGQYFNGSIDEVRIYNKSLTAAEVAELYSKSPHRILNHSTSVGDNWSACVTSDDLANVSTEVCSNGVEILAPPTVPSTCPNSWVGGGTEANPCNVTECNNISSSGFYYQLVDDETTTGTCFNITANNVTLDLSGFTITGDDTGTDHGITATGKNNLTIKNGTFELFGKTATNGYGIYFWGTTYSKIRDINVLNNGVGIYLFSNSNNNELHNIIANNNSNDGIGFFIGSNNNLYNITTNSNSDNGIELALASNNNLYNVTTSLNSDDGIEISSSNNNLFNNLNSYSNSDEEIYYIDGTGNKLIYNNSFGEISFIDALGYDVEGTLRFGNGYNIQINNNSAYVDGDILPELNKSANITLNMEGWGLTNPKIFKDSTECTDCHNFTSLIASTVIFNVSSWSNYTLVEDTTPPSVTIDYPLEGYLYGQVPMPLNCTITDANHDSSWWTTGYYNNTFSGNTTTMNLNYTATFTVTVYANDTFGNMASDSVTFDYAYGEDEPYVQQQCGYTYSFFNQTSGVRTNVSFIGDDGRYCNLISGVCST